MILYVGLKLSGMWVRSPEATIEISICPSVSINQNAYDTLSAQPLSLPSVAVVGWSQREEVQILALLEGAVAEVEEVLVGGMEGQAYSTVVAGAPVAPPE
jgi:hypothetical protein